jgi:hypothetical protein
VADDQKVADVLASTDEALEELARSVDGLLPEDGTTPEDLQALYHRLAAMDEQEAAELPEDLRDVRTRLLEIRPEHRDAVFGFPRGHGPHTRDAEYDDDEDEDDEPGMCPACRAQMALVIIRREFAVFIAPLINADDDGRVLSRCARDNFNRAVDALEDLVDTARNAGC